MLENLEKYWCYRKPSKLPLSIVAVRLLELKPFPSGGADVKHNEGTDFKKGIQVAARRMTAAGGASGQG
jgi:hypothetical protein